MPELPEVETSKRGIAPHTEGRRVTGLVVRNGQLRWPVPDDLASHVVGRTLKSISRRGKYLLLAFTNGHLIVHLGMSGSLRMVQAEEPAGFHDHIDLRFGGQALRYTDPRRFGCWLWACGDVNAHKLLAHLGPEPLSEAFNADYLYQRARGRKQNLKNFIMDSQLVVGVGNIYANEALFLAGLRPRAAAGSLTRPKAAKLVAHIKAVLAAAIAQGGTTLKDFVGGDGKPGYFKQQLYVYGRGGQACRICHSLLKEVRVNNRATVYCAQCQR
ncbi:bifunctional DNA-formamidopyrimidine glycosylase/DNA-(apurinic or apyrimidinic site) lyase [Simiduia sp. 21SJ11W-1]|uniref:bifunctional DNA-formamidopyrimidine glycosylase/DNA-(apurinic or apyrimidinic site) lyase n=1 Tax=Simiduia sp. 21SJ11W-1 TaxID=2909669 RepID=UPI0020A0004B|nr:bifunctional DNA-formamidopyrimidine glycosylase/DNA-(apurinic or apyrimidinic site) lyase [Simiduia sp. 21SJ11W-1]UTA48011.1 bifunctional DNA-formamidopyrimidine glycosylase/DNA-(apurinic or apyrimidinic site) lyase [Simiduia sp. 21SJ11W-1]